MRKQAAAVLGWAAANEVIIDALTNAAATDEPVYSHSGSISVRLTQEMHRTRRGCVINRSHWKRSLGKSYIIIKCAALNWKYACVCHIWAAPQPNTGPNLEKQPRFRHRAWNEWGGVKMSTPNKCECPDYYGPLIVPLIATPPLVSPMAKPMQVWQHRNPAQVRCRSLSTRGQERGRPPAFSTGPACWMLTQTSIT